ncbi:MAG: NlpC/P60 family protein [Hyphomicrobiaceae bacterium]
MNSCCVLRPPADVALDRACIVLIARGWLGTPYHHQSSVKGVGADCLGIVRGVYRELMGREPAAMPPYTRDWGEASGKETLLDAARLHLVASPTGVPRPGDVVVFRVRRAAVAKHVGIATAADRMIHAVERSGCVEVPLSLWWRRRIASVYRFPGMID